MNIVKRLLRKRFHIYGLGLLVLSAILVGSGVDSQLISAQAANSIYLTPSSGPAAIGSTIAVTVRENSGSQVNAVEADIAYSTSLLQFVSIDGGSSAFGIDASSAGGDGAVTIARGSTKPLTGDQLVAKVNFKVLAPGTANLQMRDSSIVLSSSTNSNIVSARNGASFSVASNGSPSPTPTPTPSPTPTPNPTPSTSPSPSASSSSNKKPTAAAVVSVAPKGNPTGTPLPGDSVVELSTPATLQTSPAAGKEVSKVEYYVNGKLVATVANPPYSYSIKTESYRNGTYTITTKTYYKDNKVESSNASLVVKNQFGATQLYLQLRHYAWLVLVLLLVAAELTWLSFSKRRRAKNDPYGVYSANSIPVVVGADGGNGNFNATARSLASALDSTPLSTSPTVSAPSQTPVSDQQPASDPLHPAEVTFGTPTTITPSNPQVAPSVPVAGPRPEPTSSPASSDQESANPADPPTPPRPA